MAEAEHGLTDMAYNNNSRYHGDQTLLVRFFTKAKRNLARSEEEDRPIFEDVTYIEIMQPGNKDSIIRRPATDMDIDRFPDHHRRFEARESEEHVDGTLLSEWPAISRAQVEELKFLNVRTVEQLAAIADSNAQNIMGIQVLKSKAVKFLETAKDSQMAQKFAELEAKYDALLEGQSKPAKRGRPRKAATEEAAEE